ncbi:uncharacterized protein EI97DRAFT_470813 [Westerdykella ornata]|uniref:Glycosyl transferase CAP10 domain-containing protein n=1 Tax=Westerdykella ornata TaxID=318751 RepID=A0A6A6J6S4_WESOR|nr:uncharacterized protein EI97DRAFT_470813 [Westerdykella ornata]KAF2271917.1 hypothetical protein EI97DRAFT_470813 [Westerdykella ornata]
MEEEECRRVFPGLLLDVDDMMRRGEFVFEKGDGGYMGLVQGRVWGGELYILTTSPTRTPQLHHQRLATLSQIHRALLTSPSPLPNTHFAFVTNDVPKNDSWAFAKVNKQSNQNVWLMPHFAFWGWTGAAGRELGTMDEALSRIAKVEKGMRSWEEKVDKLVWRGTPWFNPLAYPTLRQDLLRVTRGMPWADVQALKPSAGGRGGYSNALPIEEFCRYKYVVYTEGVTYSGRLAYHQACKSVLIMAPLTYLTYTTRAMRPIWVEDLVSGVGGGKQVGIGDRVLFDETKTMKTGKKAWGQQSTPILKTLGRERWKEANAIYVSPDFSNLEDTVAFLEGHPEVAERIARNLRDAVVGGGVLSRAAETCYWRGLIRGWARVAREGESWGKERGVRFEEWVLGQVGKETGR